MRLTLDTNILVRASISSRGPARRLLDLVAAGGHTLVLSRYILDEVRDVLSRPRLQRLSPQSAEDIGIYVDLLAAVAEIVEPTMHDPVIINDPGDDPILFTAVAGHCEVLCTANLRHFTTPDVSAFCNAHGIRVLSDVDVLNELAGPDIQSQ